MGGCVGRIWKEYREGNHNQDIICDKKNQFSTEGEKVKMKKHMLKSCVLG